MRQTKCDTLRSTHLENVRESKEKDVRSLQERHKLSTGWEENLDNTLKQNEAFRQLITHIAGHKDLSIGKVGSMLGYLFDKPSPQVSVTSLNVSIGRWTIDWAINSGYVMRLNVYDDGWGDSGCATRLSTKKMEDVLPLIRKEDPSI